MSRRTLIGAVGGLTAALLLLAPVAVAATPDAPTLVQPADGTTASSGDVQLAARATDPDGGAVDVRFVGRKAGATVTTGGSGSPFTLVVLPDTQNYTYNGRQGTIATQAQWVVDSRARLGTAMVVQLGDLVSSFDVAHQWDYTSAGLKVLDDAGVPNTVVAGNHDFDNATGTFTAYDTYFPPSRYADARWTPSTARYGGYLGQNLFGPDPVDRRNMDSFALFSAGGRDFLVLNLEWEAPSYALDWATKVLAAYPDRTAIMVTHSFVGLTGQRLTRAERPGGTPVDRLWSDFVSQQCSIRLVLNGHYHDGNSGEAHRSDLNRCGQPVQQILTDYQDRPNGGDGWLRTYTFDPAQNTMTAATYSPTLQQYETDADAAFTLPFDLGTTVQPAPFTTIGTAHVDSGATARTTWTGLAPDTLYEWRAVADDGTSTATSPTWTVRTPPAGDVLDGFGRDVSGGWGDADANHAWQVSGAVSSYAVSGGAGRMTTVPGSTRTATLTGLASTDQRVDADLSVDRAATGSGTYVSALTRVRSGNAYRAKLRYLSDRSLSLTLTRVVDNVETTLASAPVPGLTVVPGQPLRLRAETTGTPSTTLRGKVWSAGTAEPSTWTVTTTDTTAALQVAGTAGVDVYASSTASSPQTLLVDRYGVAGAAVPTNQPPVAVIGSPTADGRSVTLSGSASSDPDGTVTGYAWDLGDGATAAGASTTHAYAADGTFTVTDDKGATATTTRQVALAGPVAGALARDGFTRTSSSGWGTAETGGSWTTSGSTSRYAVAGGAGQQLLAAPGTSADAALRDVSSTATDLRVSLTWSRSAAGGTLYASVVPRRVSDAADYRCKLVGLASGAVQLQLVRRNGGAETSLGTTTVKDLTVAASQPYRVACRAVPSGTATRLTAKVWRAAGTEPSDWQLSMTDATAGLQGPGGVAVGTYASSSATAGVTTTVDDLVAVSP